MPTPDEVYPDKYKRNRRPDRSCGSCGKVIYYGLFCSNECSDRAYHAWREAESMADPCRCPSCDELGG